MRADVIKRILEYVKPYKAMLVAAFLSAIVSVPLGLLAPVLIGRAIDCVVAPGAVDFESIIKILLMVALTVTVSSLFMWLMQVLTRKLSAYAAQDMRKEAFEHINKAPLSRLDTHPHGDIVSRMVNDVDAVSEGLLQALCQLLPGIITIVSTIIVMCILNFKIAVIVVLVTPLSIFFAKFIGGRTSKYFRDQTETQGKLSSYVNEMVGNQPLVQAMGSEDISCEEFVKLSEDYYQANFKATFFSSVINPGTRFVNAIVYAIVGVFGAFYAVSGAITIGGLSAILTYANQYTKPFNDITSVLTQLQSAVASAERIFQIIDWESEIPDHANALTPQSCEGNVAAQHVYFSYIRNKPLIEDFSLNVPAGSRIAIVGPTGCGKTTLINLLMRFYEVNSGEILVDKTPIKKITRSSLRGLYGMVLQETWLKSASVRDNIAYARPDAAIEDVVAAAKTALAHSFIERLPQGYDTIVKDGGSNLSAGQRQLLCIARIVLSKPDMLILDEATSSIDTRTEIAIQKAMDRLMQGHTSFVVAHRLSTIKNADHILVMESGHIVEQGTHDELLEKGGFYAKLFKSQFAQV